MGIITYSDLHLEFGSGWMLPPDANGDVMILAGGLAIVPIPKEEWDPELPVRWKAVFINDPDSKT
jgi:hypothetical protein